MERWMVQRPPPAFTYSNKHDCSGGDDSLHSGKFPGLHPGDVKVLENKEDDVADFDLADIFLFNGVWHFLKGYCHEN
jgi:hypothetical protein